MKKEKIIYWVSTGIVAAVMLWSAYNFTFNPVMKDAFAHLGLPNWFRIELTIAKLLGSIALLLTIIPRKLKEFVYFGFGITLISASVAHLSSGDSIWLEAGHSFFLISLIVSYLYYQKIIANNKVNQLPGMQRIS